MEPVATADTPPRPSLPHRAPPLRVVVVGGGAASVMAAHHLLDRATADRPVDVTVVERDGAVGPGLPYRTAHPWHLLNNYAGRLSAVDGDPDHLVRWAVARGLGVTGTSFLPRRLYGDYLREVAEGTTAPARSSLTHAAGEVVDVQPPTAGRAGCSAPAPLRVAVSDGGGRTTHLEADHVVLALGTPPPRRIRHLEHLGDRYVADPWRTDLTAAAAGAKEVLVVGTGLTMVDVVCALHHDRPDLRFTAVSRSGLLPTEHRPGDHTLHDVLVPRGRRLDDVLTSVDDALATIAATGRGGWRDVVDSLRADANGLWDGFTDAEQDRFLTDHARRWDVHRHRMAPATATLLRRLLDDRVVRLDHPSAADPSDAGLVVNATGPRSACEPGWSPLVDRLTDTGVVRAHRLGLGLDLAPGGHPVGADGTVDPRMTVLGAARRGLEWEVSAVPDVRAQAASMARAVLPTAAAASAAGAARASRA